MTSARPLVRLSSILLSLALASCDGGDRRPVPSPSADTGADTDTDTDTDTDADTDTDTDADPEPVNLLSNPGFEDWDGTSMPTGWLIYPTDLGNWGNVATGDGMYPDDVPFTANEGNYSFKLHGQYSGLMNETPVYQELAASEGQRFTLEGYAYMYSNDLVDSEASYGNIWLKYFDDSYNYYGMDSSAVTLTSTSTPDTWTSMSVSGDVPKGVTKVHAGFSYWHCQGATSDCHDGGSVYYDDLLLYEVTP